MPEFRLSTFDNKRKWQHQMLFLHEFSVKLRWFCICKLVICIYEGYDLHWTFNRVEINTTDVCRKGLVCERNQWSVLSFWFFMRPDEWHQRQLTFDALTGQTAKACNKLDLPDKSLRPNSRRMSAPNPKFTCWFFLIYYWHFCFVSVTFALRMSFCQTHKISRFSKTRYCYILLYYF